MATWGPLGRFLGLTDSSQAGSENMDNKQNVPLSGPSVHVVSRNPAELREILLNRFGCEATFEGVEFQGGSKTLKKRKAPAPPSQRYGVTLPSGVRVSVWKADLTQLNVDAVVNAANTHLSHGAGLAAALSKAGGPQIKRDSDDYIHKYGPLKTGQAIIFDAGFLPCKKLIHAVGPRLAHHSEVKQARPQLEKVIGSILDIVVKHQLNTVAIPAISSGLFNYPLADCAHTIVTTVKRYFGSLPSYKFIQNPIEIQLVNNDDPTVTAMLKACYQILGSPSSKSYSQAVSSNTRSSANTPPITVQIGNVLVRLMKDRIEEQQTDVIVNTTWSKNLNSGAISKALLKKAGYKMQQEINNAQQKGRIIVTKSHDLECKEVFHTFCVDKADFNASQVLYTCVWECLTMAEKHHRRSIAFPAIGTGGLGFTGQEVASIMSQAVMNFAKCRKDRFEVHFVIFPSDVSTFEAFEMEMRSLKSRQSTANVPLASVNPDESRSKKSGTPHISLMGPSAESIREAKRWLNDLFRFSEITIQNNFIQHFSDQEYQQLALFNQDGVSVEEFFTKGHACISLNSESQETVSEAALQVEAMLQEVQKAFVTEETKEIQLMTQSEVLFCDRKTVDRSSHEFIDVVKPFKDLPMSPVKVEKVENTALEILFSVKQSQLQCSTRKMYQCIPAQFCNMISRVGFHAEIAPPEAPDFGEGIYFAATVEKARDLWRGSKEEYLYFVEAVVLEGNSTRGKPGLILPPNDSQGSFNSVNGGNEIVVIFSGYQALPRYIITCGK
ncbi:protein mono-ADP-ribosyltransferase PARP9-like [Salarias fasciatus]|uniref:protein mono-ADP-ribosyltransferase PARP9-like n=1 Tax=Salarias fasciatus TaxID=181472 RepID=UPI001176CA43|nr:protein mono-ADP-ribosyltransferase PARP9-like [Salarias fasciatus]